MSKVAVYRKEHFNAAHRLNNPAWDAEKNKQTFLVSATCPIIMVIIMNWW